MEKLIQLIGQFKFLRYLPALFFLITYSFYFIKGSSLFFWIFLALFLAASGLIIWVDLKNPAKQFKKTLSSKITLILTLMIIVFVYLLLLKYPVSIDLTEDQMFTLSPKTKETVKNLQGNVKILVFQDDRTPDVNLKQWGSRIYEHVKKLLEEYKRQNPNLEVLFINPDSDTLNVSRYQPKKVGDIIIDSEQGRRYINKEELVKWKVQQSPYGQMERVIEAYLAEEKITSSLISLSEQGKPIILWLEGDGEVDLDGEGSASSLKAELENNLYEVKKISAHKKFEAKGDVIFIAGPTKTIPKEMVGDIESFIKQGKILVLLKDPSLDNIPSGLEALVKKEYKIDLLNQIILDDKQAYRSVENIIPDYAHHPITEALSRKNLPLIFPFASALKLGLGATPLLEASTTAWAENDLKKLKATGKPSGSRNTGKEKIVLAALAENQEHKSKLLVIGNSNFIREGNIQVGGNKDFILNSLNFLLQKKAPLSISKAVEKERFLTLNDGQRQFYFYVFVILLPVLIIGIGIWVGFNRRKLKNPEA